MPNHMKLPISGTLIGPGGSLVFGKTTWERDVRRVATEMEIKTKIQTSIFVINKPNVTSNKRLCLCDLSILHVCLRKIYMNGMKTRKEQKRKQTEM